jgi:hypothetical protein
MEVCSMKKIGKSILQSLGLFVFCTSIMASAGANERSFERLECYAPSHIGFIAILSPEDLESGFQISKALFKDNYSSARMICETNNDLSGYSCVGQWSDGGVARVEVFIGEDNTITAALDSKTSGRKNVSCEQRVCEWTPDGTSCY